MLAELPPLPCKRLSATRPLLPPILFSLLITLVAALVAWLFVTDEDGFDGEGGGLALITFYVVSIIFTVAAALVSGVFAFGSFLAVRLIVRRTHNNEIRSRNA